MVAAGAPVLVLESMKMETAVRAPFPARVRELLVTTGSQVETGAPLVRLEPVDDGADAEQAAPEETAPALDLPTAAVAASPRERATHARMDVASILMGYDVDPSDEGAHIHEYLAARDELAAAGGDVVRDEIELLGMFADLAELSRNRPAGEDLHTELRVHSSREHFHVFLQSLDVERGGLPDQFRSRLARVLAHYGVSDTDRTRQLEEAVFRIFLAQQRSAPDLLLATEVLQRWIAAPPPSAELAGARSQPPRAPGQVHPAAVPRRWRPGTQHPLPVVRPAAGRRRALQRAGRRTRRGRCARR